MQNYKSIYRQARRKALVLEMICLPVFLLMQNVLNGQTLTNLYNFTDSTDGANPTAGMVVSGATLYGTATAGGSSGYGTVFSISTSGTGFTTLHSLNGTTDGSSPSGTLVLSGSTLYGTAGSGGANGYGTIFSISTSGTGFTTLYSFNGTTDGSYPTAGLVLSGTTLYGVANEGGSSGYGSVFSISTSGTGFTTLHSFNGTTDGSYPEGALVLSGTTLYGTAYSGGASGNGTIFSIGTGGTGFTTLQSFTGGTTDGANPTGSLFLSGSILYGTAVNAGSAGGGTLFAINTSGSGYTTLYNFGTTASPGDNPNGGLTIVGNTLFGTAYDGGANGDGTVYAVGTNGLNFQVLYTFAGTDGENPYGLSVSDGVTLYGTTDNGGSSGYGTVFSVPTVCSPTTTDWWKGENNALDSVGSKNGTTHSITYTTGYSGYGFEFNGSSSYIGFGSSGFDSGNFGTNDFAIDFWMQTASTVLQDVLSKRSVCGYGSLWDFRMGSSGGIQVEICNDSAGTYYRSLKSTTVVNDDNFHEITFVRQKKALSFYVDGILEDSTTTTGIIDINNTATMAAGEDVCIGQDGTHYFDGVLDNINLGTPCP